MLFQRFLLSLVFFLGVVSAHAETVRLPSELKGWPWHESTILAAVSFPSVKSGKEIFIRHPEKKESPMKMNLWRAKASPRGLYIVIPGTGSDANSGTANLLAQKLSAEGFDALVAANPFSRSFQKSFSSDGLIGFPQKDADDLVVMVHQAYRAYVTRYGRPLQVRMIGYSLGATYVGALGGKKLGFPVSQYVLLNPPVRFGYAMEQLDRMMREARNDDEFSLMKLIGDVIPLFKIAETGITTEILPELRARLRRPEYANSHIIGASFGIDLMSITLGLKKSKHFAGRENQVRMNGRALRMSFERYLGLVGIAISNSGYPGFRNGTFESMVDQVDLKNIMAGNKNKSKTIIITNEDDFLIQKKDLKTVSGLGVKSVYIFDGGGHCGNYWTKSFGGLLTKVAR